MRHGAGFNRCAVALMRSWRLENFKRRAGRILENGQRTPVDRNNKLPTGSCLREIICDNAPSKFKH